MVVTKKDVDEIVKMLLINNQKIIHGYVIASLYFKIGEFHTALKYVSNYLMIKPHCFIAYKLQGECYEKLNRIHDALNSYERALDSVERKKNLKRPVRSYEEIAKEITCKESRLLQLSKENAVTSTTYERNMEEMEPAIHHADLADETCSDTTFSFKVDHVSTLDCVCSSELFFFKNISWRIFVQPIRDLGVHRNFAFFLMCTGENDPLWSCNVEVEFRLLAVKHGQYPYVQKLRHLFNHQEDIWGFPRFISWNDVVGPGNKYMQNDCITVQVHIKVLD